MPSDEATIAKGRALSDAKWELPDRYRLDGVLLALPPEELKAKDPELYARWEAIKQKQEEWSRGAHNPFSEPSPQDADRARSVKIAENLRQVLDGLNKRIGAAVTTGDGEVGELQEAQRAVRHKLAERYGVIGRYDLAFQAEPEEVYREHYRSILEAIYREDDEVCQCGPLRGSGGHADIEVHQTRVMEEIFSLKHGSVCYLLRCNGCGFTNVVPTLPVHIQEQRAHRAQARHVAGRMSPANASAELKRLGHTSAKLLKK